MIMAARVKAGWIEQPEETVETEGSAEEAETEAQPS
jgi:N utilization substance protein A